MECPYCGSSKLHVIETREVNSESTRRRRGCLKCRKRFTTYERIEMIPLVVVKKNGTREPFSKDKLINGLVRACEKRPITLEQMHTIADHVESRLLTRGKGEVSSAKIGELVISRLKHFDKVAYIRFASVYKDFKDTESFISEIRMIKKKPSRKQKRVEQNDRMENRI